jgi:hypothetical protein
MTKTMKVEGPLHVICQCDKCKPQISFNAEVIGYVEPQRTWVGLTDEEKQEWIDAMPYDPQPRHCMILVNIIEAKLKEKNG